MKNNNQKKNKEDIISVANLINDFGDEDVEKRVNSASNLKSIATGLGKQRIKNQLIPFILSQIIDDENQVVIALLNNIEVLGEIMGSTVNYTFLFPLMQQIIQHQDKKVRKLAVQKYLNIVTSADPQKSQPQIMISMKRIMDFQYIQSREAVASVIGNLLGKFSENNQQILINIYISMVESQTSDKKFASMYSKDLVKWLPNNEAVILKIVDMLFKDKEESNKIYLIDTIIQLARSKSMTFLQSYFNLISYQFTWRIRYELIFKIDKLAETMGKQYFKSFLAYIIKYLNDIQAEIRSISCIKLKEILPYFDAEEITTKIIPALKNTHQDAHIYVKNAFADVVLQFCPIIGKKNTTQLILPKFLHLLKDENQQIRITIFSHVDIICKTLGVQTLSQSVLPALNELIQHTNWRIRAQSIDMFVYFVKQMGSQFLNQKNLKTVLDFIRDKASAVRMKGIELLGRIIDEVGNQWFQKNLLPKLLQIFKATSYLQRQTALFVIKKIAAKLNIQVVTKSIIPGVITLCNDPVQNVRLTSCKVLVQLYGIASAKQKQSIKKCLRSLKDDKDKDVKEIAEESEKKIK